DNGGNAPAFKTFAEDNSYAHNKGLLNPTDGNTMYGHALDDIIQPDSATPAGGCSVLSNPKLKRFSNVRLVGTYPEVRYGMANQ
ncbi:MAG TPA: hypothetical protein VJM83_03580, partial [Nitrospirota bacterium]|nr:hypothetical protein [Nitrospirota bacterium]